VSTDTPTGGPVLDLAWFGVGLAVALAWRLREYPRMAWHAAWHPGCTH
jgi:hypothetical protein